MKADFDLFEKITEGTEKITEKDGVFSFYRRGENLISTSGIKLRFLTSGSFVSFGFEVYFEDERKNGAIDFCQNGVLLDHYAFDLKCEETLHARFDFDIHGEKLCEIYLPYTVGVRIFDFESDGDMIPLSKRRVLVAFGDDIIRGNGALYPSLTLMSRLANRLDMSLINKAETKSGYNSDIIIMERVVPDTIFVMYGTFDFENTEKDVFVKRCEDFYKKLKNTYPTAKIYAVTPLWRQDNDALKVFGRLSELRFAVEDIANRFGIDVIDGEGITPSGIFYFEDLIKYPSDLGADIICENIIKKIKDK